MSLLKLSAIFLLFAACIALTGCNSTMRSMIGEYNVNSVQLARKCELDSALSLVKKSREHQSIVNQSQGLLLEIVYLNELGREQEARDIYPSLMERSPWHKNEKEIDKAVKRSRRDLAKMRKRSGFDKECPTQ